MSDYSISTVSGTDRYTWKQIKLLLQTEGIRRDSHLDYTCVMYDDDMQVIATGSCFGSTLRCMAVSHTHQGEGLMNEIVSHLISVQYARGNTHLFLYTKCSSAAFFSSLGFHEIVRIPDQIVFMENKPRGFSDYLVSLQKSSPSTGDQKVAAIVMNANPFTLGHQYLVEKAAAENDLVHLFLVSEDRSLFPASIRRRLVQDGIAHLKNVILHDTASYIISQATFPGYFQKDETAVLESQARLDLTVFSRIAETLSIQKRYVGEEPFSQVTGLYNRIMQQELSLHDIKTVIVPRFCRNEVPVSASAVRQAVRENDMAALSQLVPASTLSWIQSPDAAPIIVNIKVADNVIHY